MNQPELGLKIAELRKTKGFTQQELSDRCNINIRTLQRIESGKVVPRVYSIKLILKALGLNYSNVFGDEEISTSQGHYMEKVKNFLFLDKKPEESHISNGLLWAWIMGIVYFAAGFPDFALGAKAIESFLSPGEEFFFIISKVVLAVAYVFFMRGFIILGKTLDMPILSIVSTIMVFVLPAIAAMEVVVQLSGHNILGVVVGGGICIGVLQIIFGYCLFKSEREFGRIGVIAGVLQIVAGVTFVTVILGFIGLFMLIPIEILEIVILVKFYMKKSELGFDTTTQHARN